MKVGEITDICKFTLILVAEFDSRFVCHTTFLIKNFKKVVDQHTERIYHIRETGQEWSILRHRLIKNVTVLRHNKIISMASQMALMVKNPSAAKGGIRDVGLIPGSGRSPAGGHATHSSVLAWRSPWTEEPGGPQSVGSHRVRHDWSGWAPKWKLLLRKEKENYWHQVIFCNHIWLEQIERCIQMTILPMLIYKFNIKLIKMPRCLFCCCCW